LGVRPFPRREGSLISTRDYPLTWERNASQAKYVGMDVVDPIFKPRAPPVHAAEVLLYLLECDEPQG
jgi:hypothetical protein